jgi:hypothetical protein
MKTVSVKTKNGGITIGNIDEKGRVVYLAGHWVPCKDLDRLNEIFRSKIEEIIHDGGLMYKEMIAHI